MLRVFDQGYQKIRSDKCTPNTEFDILARTSGDDAHLLLGWVLEAWKKIIAYNLTMWKCRLLGTRSHKDLDKLGWMSRFHKKAWRTHHLPRPQKFTSETGTRFIRISMVVVLHRPGLTVGEVVPECGMLLKVEMTEA